MNDIVEYLDRHDEASITDIARELDADRHRVSKELQLLEQQGTVTCRQHGPAKLWSLADHPVVELLDSKSEATTTLRSLIDNLHGQVSIQDTSLDLAWPDADDNTTETCYEHHLGRDEQCPECPIEDVVSTGETQTITTTSDKGKTTITLIPIKDDNDNVTNVAEHMIQW